MSTVHIEVHRSSVVAFTAIYSIFILNDLALDLTTTSLEWVGLDCLIRVVALTSLFWYQPFRNVIRDGLMPKPQTKWVWYILGFTFILLNVDSLLIREVQFAFPEWRWGIGTFPGYDNDGVRWFDWTVGLLLVSISEEIISRGLFRYVFEMFSKNRFWLVICSSVAFAVLHWGYGPIGMLLPLAAGILLMIAYLNTGSLIPGIIIHYLLNLNVYTYTP